jgi:uncharacterized protein YbbC (DUF1343 family)
MLGAPWIHAADLIANLNRRQIPGVSFARAAFTPTADALKGQPCEGVTLTLTDRAAFRSMRLGLELADALHRLYPDQFQLDKIIALLGSQDAVFQLQQGTPATAIIASWAPDLARFSQLRAQYFLYH